MIYIYNFNIFAMKKNNIKTSKGSNSRGIAANVLTALTRTNEGDVEPFTPEQVMAFYKGEDSIAEVSTEESEDSVEPGKGQIKPQLKADLSTETTEMQEAITDIRNWINEVKQRPVTGKRKFIYLDGDILEIFSELRKSTGLPATQYINNILLDWIDVHKDAIVAIINARARNRIINDI
jgi:hypothetical protein